MGNHSLVMTFFSVGDSLSETRRNCMNDGLSDTTLGLIHVRVAKVRGRLPQPPPLRLFRHLNNSLITGDGN